MVTENGYQSIVKFQETIPVFHRLFKLPVKIPGFISSVRRVI